MKIVKIFLFLAILISFFSCNKDDDQEIISESPVNIYKGESNSNDGLQADVTEGDYKTYFYGDFHQNGSPKNVKSIVLEKKLSDTLYNFLVDNQHRIYMAYTSLKNGNKLSRLVKMDFVDDNNAFMNFYDYNWNDNTDVLVKQIAVNYENQTAISTYGKFGDDDEFMFSTSEIKKFLIKHSGIVGGVAIVATALTCGGSAGLACGPALLAVSTAVMLLNSNIVKADTLNPNLPSHPQSPTNGTIPNPKGTPSDPTNDYGLIKSKLLGKWKLIDYIENGVSNSTPIQQCISDNIITFSNTEITFNEGTNKCYIQTPQSTSINFNLNYNHTFNGSRIYSITSFTGLTGTGSGTGYLPITMNFSLYWGNFGSSGGQEYLVLQEWGSLSNIFRYIKVP